MCSFTILDDDPNLIQQTEFTANLDQINGTTTFFIFEEAKGTILHFSKENVKVFQFYF